MNRMMHIIAAAVVLSSAYHSFADRTVSITALDEGEGTVSLAFGGTSDAAENVYVAYGSTDCGGNFHAWANRTALGTIAADATSGSYDLPDAITSGVYYRFFVGDKPYDREVTYIRGDGKSWTNTGYNPSSANKIAMKIYRDGSEWNSLENIYCARGSGSSSRTFMGIMSAGTLRVDRYTTMNAQNKTIPLAVQEAHTISIDYTSTAIYTNGVSASTMKNSTAYTATGYLTLFTTHDFGYSVDTTASGSHLGEYRLYYFKLFDQSDNLELDLVPVVSNNVATLYDTISGKVLSRYGTSGGAFIAGDHVKFAVESTETRLCGSLSVTTENYYKDFTISHPALTTNAALWAVYSTNTDYGAYSPNEWDHYVKIADLASGSTGGDYSLDLMAGDNDTYTYKRLRFVIAPAADQDTPFDRELEYLHTANSGYVDTGLVPTCRDIVEMKVNMTSCNNGGLWSARKKSQVNALSCFAMSIKQFRFDRYNEYNNYSGTFTLGSDYILYADYLTRLYEITGTIDGDSSGTINNAGKFTPGSNLYLFGVNNDGTISNFADAKMYYFTLRDEAEALKLDLIPVLKDGTVCLYNKVDGSILTPTADFTAGDNASTRYGMEPLMTSAVCYDSRSTSAPAFARMVDSDGDGTYSWVFYSLEMEEVSTSLTAPDASIVVLLGSDAEIDAVLADKTSQGWTSDGYKLYNFVVSSDNYAFDKIDSFGIIEGTTIDLAGHSITLPTSIRDAAVALTVTDSSAAGSGGTLTISVAEDVSFTNSLITLSGSLALAKSGAGEYVEQMSTQSYTGGVVVQGGTFVPGVNGTGVFGAAGGTVTVDSGATLEMNGRTNLVAYTFVLNGGTLTNAGLMDNGNAVVPTTCTTFSNLVLTADSTINVTTRYGISSLVGDGITHIDLGNHTLTVDCNEYVVWFDIRDTVIENGTIVTAENRGTFSPRGNIVATNNVTFEMHDTFCTKPVNTGDAVMLCNYRDCIPAANYTMGGHDTDIVKVYGTFTPTTAYYHGLTMMDGSVLDVSEYSGAMPVVSSRSEINALSFASGATVTLNIDGKSDLAEIVASDSPYVVTWSTTTKPDSTVTFELDSTSAETYSIITNDSGIAVQDATSKATVFYARMAKGEGDEYAWKFYNALWEDNTELAIAAGTTYPTSNTIVYFDSGAELEAIEADRTANGWTAKACYTTGFTVPYDNFDITALSTTFEIESGSTIDLAGHDFALPSSLVGGSVAFTVTDSSAAGEGGELSVSVDEDTTCHNYNVALTGSLTFVKKGAGIFAMRTNSNTYTGGTRIEVGGLETIGANGISDTAGIIGTAPSTVTVCEDGTLDICGRQNLVDYSIVLNGGTLTSRVGCSDSATSLTNISLTADSTIILNNVFVLRGDGRTSLDLGGNTLTITASANYRCHLFDMDIKNGTIVVTNVTSGAYTYLNPRNTVVATNNVTFIIDSKFEAFVSDDNPVMYLDTYVAHSANNGTLASGTTNFLMICGSFTPYVTAYHGMTMMDGSTLDLSNLDDALPTVSTISGTNDEAKKLSFADNATIYVKLGSRNVSASDPIVSWTTAPTNLDTLTFKCGDSSRSFSVVKKDDGLYVQMGMVMIVR